MREARGHSATTKAFEELVVDATETPIAEDDDHFPSLGALRELLGGATQVSFMASPSPAGLAGGPENRFHQVAAGGFSIGAGDAHHPQFPGRVTVEGGGGLAQSSATVRHFDDHAAFL